MLGISNIGEKQASTYYTKDGYYARNESDDRWLGNLREELDLPKQVTKHDFDQFVLGKQRAGCDLCFSAPKSVSVAMTLSPEIRNDMLAAHNAAVSDTLQLIEQREIGTRVRDGKKQNHIKTGKMLAGCFNHYVSRNSDPQLHTHAVVLNITKHNGKLYAVDNPPLYENKILYGQIYRNTLAKELMSRGYAVISTDKDKGFFELQGVSVESLEQFSSRRKEIVQKLREWGNNTPEAAEKAALLTRKAKEHKDLNVLMSSWKETLSEMGEIKVYKLPKENFPDIEKKQLEFNQAVDCLSSKSFAFTEKELKRAVLAAGVGSGMSEDEYEQFKTINLASKHLCRLSTAQGDTYYSTQSNIETEREIFKEVAFTKNTFAGMQDEFVDRIVNHQLSVDKTTLSEQQRQAVHHITTSRDQYVAVQGLAGTGKTHMLNYTRCVLESDGYKVLGACFTGKAAQGLEQDAHIPSTTIHALLNRLEKESGNAPEPNLDKKIKNTWNFSGLKTGKKREAWIIDEASMVDNSTLRYVMEAAQIKGAKIVLVGDRKQLLPIGVGNAFATLTESKKISTTTLTEIRRQQDNPKLLQAVREAVSGNVSASLAAIPTEIIEKRGKRIKAIINDYVKLTPSAQEKTVILTAGNRDRHDINNAIREKLVKEGQIDAGQEFTVVNPTTEQESKRLFAIGDKVVFLQNDYKLGVRNAQTGTVKELLPNTLVIASGNEQLSVNLTQYNAIDYGYAMTSHKAQGITVERVLVHLDSAQKQLNSRNAYYVDISRAKYEVKLYVDDIKKVENQVRQFSKKLTIDYFMATKDEKKESFQKSKPNPFLDIKSAELQQTQQSGMNGMSLGR